MMAVSQQFRRRVCYVAPVVVAAVLGGTWIALHAGGSRGHAHTVWQSLVVAENAVALSLRRRKPVGSLAGILLVYVVFQLYVITLLPASVALFAVTRACGRRTAVVAAVVTAVVLVLAPYLLGAR
jgi:hypothetical protein